MHKTFAAKEYNQMFTSKSRLRLVMNLLIEIGGICMQVDSELSLRLECYRFDS